MTKFQKWAVTTLLRELWWLYFTSSLEPFASLWRMTAASYMFTARKISNTEMPVFNILPKI